MRQEHSHKRKLASRTTPTQRKLTLSAHGDWIQPRFPAEKTRSREGVGRWSRKEKETDKHLEVQMPVFKFQGLSPALI